MRQYMALQVGELCKSTATDIASVRLLSRVDAVVNFKMRCQSERFGTFLTFIRLLTSVN